MQEIDRNLQSFLDLQKQELGRLLGNIKGRTEELRTLARRNAVDVINIGTRLNQVKERIPGFFKKWCEDNIPMCYHQIWVYMRIATKFSSKNIDADALAKIPLSALEILCSSSTTEEAIQQVLQLVENGEKITIGLVEKVKAESAGTPQKCYHNRLPAPIVSKLKLICSEFPPELVMEKLNELERELRKVSNK